MGLPATAPHGGKTSVLHEAVASAKRVDEIFATRTRPLSFEIFPPKVSNRDLARAQAREVMAGLAPLKPDFVSVTCSAGGTGDADNTAVVAALVQDEFGIPAIAHLTCRSLTHESLAERLRELSAAGITNVLALRGDPGQDSASGDFVHACDVIPEIVEAGFCVGAAAYPEGHVSCLNLDDDLRHLREKQDSGASFLITQVCFDDDAISHFLKRCHGAGITVPITFGIMPPTSKDQLIRMAFMCAASLPAPLIRLIMQHEGDERSLQAAGISYALNQLRFLEHLGVSGLHLYTMNRPDVTAQCVRGLREG